MTKAGKNTWQFDYCTQNGTILEINKSHKYKDMGLRSYNTIVGRKNDPTVV